VFTETLGGSSVVVPAQVAGGWVEVVGAGAGGGSGRDGGRLHNSFVEAITAEVRSMVRARRKAGGGGSGAASSSSSGDELASLHDILALFVLRRTKASINLGLPPKHRRRERLTATGLQAALLATLNFCALAMLQPTSTLATALTAALGGEEGAAAAAAAPMAYIGQLANVFAPAGGPAAKKRARDSGGAEGAEGAEGDLAAVEASSSFAGSLLSLMRKAAIHPLLVRARYSNATCLHIARLLRTDSLAAAGAPKRTRKAPDAAAASSSSSSSSAAVKLPAPVALPFSSSLATLEAVAAAHVEPTAAELQQWAGSDKVLVRQAQLVLSSSVSRGQGEGRSMPPAPPSPSPHLLILSLPRRTSTSTACCGACRPRRRPGCCWSLTRSWTLSRCRPCCSCWLPRG
jgi:hypothetical protein